MVLLFNQKPYAISSLIPHNPVMIFREKSFKIMVKEKILVTSIFSFSHQVFYNVKDLFDISYLSVLLIWKGLKMIAWQWDH